MEVFVNRELTVQSPPPTPFAIFVPPCRGKLTPMTTNKLLFTDCLQLNIYKTGSNDSTHLTPMILKLMIKQGNKFGTLKKPMLSLFDVIIFDK